MRLTYIPVLLTAVSLLAATRTFTSYAAVKAVLENQPDRVPAELKNPDAAKWTEWSHQQDKAIRARLAQGDLDSMVNFLLLGTSFTKQPRIRVETITDASKSGVLRARVDDLVAGIHNPGDNERLIFLKGLLKNLGMDSTAPDGAAKMGVFLYNNLLRVLQERRALVERANRAKGGSPSGLIPDPASLLDRQSFFSDRGISLDTGLFPNFSIEQALRDLKQRGVLRPGQIVRVAVIGPGLDFIDKNDESAYDYYPQQTLQPFALYDSLVRLGLARSNTLSMSILDISSRVLDHIQRARDRARKTNGYVIQLPRDASRPWPPELIAYWRSLGNQVGTAVEPLRPPEVFAGLETRAVRVRPAVVLACESVDINVVLQRLDAVPAERFDLMVGTNIFLYYDAFEQMLALENIGSMLKPGGLLLTNDRLPEAPGGLMRQAGVTEIPFDDRGAREAIGWYQRRTSPQ